MMTWITKNLRNLLMATLVGLVTLIGLPTLFYVTTTHTRQLVDDRGQILQSLATTAATVIAENLRERRREVELLAQTPLYTRAPLDSPDFQASLNRIQASYPHYSWIGLSGHVPAEFHTWGSGNTPYLTAVAPVDIEVPAVPLDWKVLVRQPETQVLRLDIDFFKKVNDTHGHAMGDAVLRHVGALLMASLRDSDFVGRVGGEAFMAVLPMTSLSNAVNLGEKSGKKSKPRPLPPWAR